MHAGEATREDLPAGQIKHAEAFCSEYVPASQTAHVLILVAATEEEKVPATHLSQVADALPSEYSPGPQSMQVAAVDASSSMLYLPGTHDMHEDESIAATRGLYRPFPHEVHEEDPILSLYDPGLQSKHVLEA